MPRSWWTTSAGEAPWVRAIVIMRPRASENAAAVPPGLPRMTKHSRGPLYVTMNDDEFGPRECFVILGEGARTAVASLGERGELLALCGRAHRWGRGGLRGGGGHGRLLARLLRLARGEHLRVARAVPIDRYPLAVEGVGKPVGVL